MAKEVHSRSWLCYHNQAHWSH